MNINRLNGLISELLGRSARCVRFPFPTLLFSRDRGGGLQRFSAAKQKRLDTLMTKNNEGQVTPEELEELRSLVHEAEAMTLVNARALARHANGWSDSEEKQLRRPVSSRSSAVLRALVEDRAHGRCEYCRAPQRACGYRFHLDHIIPSVHGGSDLARNRALACASCNLTKAEKVSGIDPLTRAKVAVFNPRSQQWQEHFCWADDQQTILGLTPIGRTTIAVLKLNSETRKDARRLWFFLGLLPETE